MLLALSMRNTPLYYAYIWLNIVVVKVSLPFSYEALSLFPGLSYLAAKILQDR